MAFTLSFHVKQHLTLEAIAEGMTHVYSHFSIGFLQSVLKQLENKHTQIYRKRSLLEVEYKDFL